MNATLADELVVLVLVLVSLVPSVVPIHVMLLGLFRSNIQALIFATLAVAYIGESMEGHHSLVCVIYFFSLSHAIYVRLEIICWMSIIYKNKLINHINIHYIKYRSNTQKTDISGLRELQQTKGEVKKRKEIEKIFFLKF